MADTASLVDPFLVLYAEILDDYEKVRIANENRLRQLTRAVADNDGVERGFGLDESHPDVATIAALIEAISKQEHEATLKLQHRMRKHPLGPWVARTKGVGEKQAARLLAVIGDPAWNTAQDRPRTCRELYSYCGFGDAAAQVRRRGQRANWSTTGKTRAFLIAEKCVQLGKADGTRLYGVYADARARYADAVHDDACVRCGPSGSPALPGSALSLKHQHMRGLRLVAKAVLKDLWREAVAMNGLIDREEAA